MQYPKPVLSFLGFCLSSYSASLGRLEMGLTRLCSLCEFANVAEGNRPVDVFFFGNCLRGAF